MSKIIEFINLSHWFKTRTLFKPLIILLSFFSSHILKSQMQQKYCETYPQDLKPMQHSLMQLNQWSVPVYPEALKTTWRK